MPALKMEVIPYLENMIYLPMILTIVERDRMLFEQGNFKLKKPYIELLDDVARRVHKELGNTAAYLRGNRMSVVRGKMDDIFTEYIFVHDRQEDCRRYLNVRLRNRTEELLSHYLRQSDI
ncbi:hypothetical protein [Sporosarcina aquimarina]|uniref:Uncharacterized protein n=1 Tax=Sporosarcina aquimarina TaxID=114975 RepID=A0ABU4G560_9BACL|nr:hypothetical protein [Sporosarcina aquimarina]MDW0110782.1 hypothetical protein [Sporosarcina aquimarina]